METLAIFQPAYAFVDNRLEAFLGERLGSVISEVAGPLRVALVLYVMLYGFAILRGAISEPVVDFSVRSVKLGFIYALATTPAYSDFVTAPLFHTLPDTLTRAISGAGVPDVGAAFDQFFGRAAYLADKIADEASPVDLGPWILAGCVYVIGALAAALGFGVVLIAKVALALLVALGPIFIACSLFEATRRFFFGWLAQAVNYLILFALIITVFQLILSLVGQQWGQIDSSDPQAGGLIFIGLCLLGAIFFLQTPAIAAGLAGGASVGLADFANAASLGSGSRPGAPMGPQEADRKPPKAGGSIRPTGGR
ncbi:MAG: type IV secretion system protein VirB6 [Caulobacterales bacterium 68-7]|nr:type IV secretion system protein [Caulobacterales bacterium]OJU12792.1 MAG: type IV secretion system protein VirB6 [Caulobacterales bacterium 68-7]